MWGVFKYVVCFITDYFGFIFKNICHPSLFILSRTHSLKFSDLKKIPITIMVMSSWTDKILQVPAMPCRVLCCQLSPELGQASAQLQWGAGAVARPGRHQARAVGQPGHPGHPGHRTNQHTSDQHREELHQSLRNDRRDLQRMKGFPEVHVFLLCKDCFSRHIILWKKENFPNK